MSKPKNELVDILENGVRSVLASTEATTDQKIQAIAAGSKLLQIKHKIPDSESKPPSFFNKAKS